MFLKLNLMKDNIQFVLIMCLFGYVIFLQQCGQGKTEDIQEPRTTIIRMDTILPAPIIVQLPRQDISEPTIIYMDSNKNIVVNHLIDTTKHQWLNCIRIVWRMRI